MATFNILAPKLGESVQEVTITKWFFELGSMVEEDDLLFEVASDKVDSEIPSPVSGKIVDIKHVEGDVVPVGNTIAVISLDGKDEVNVTKEEAPKEDSKTISEVALEKTEIDIPDNRFYSPLVKNIAKVEQLSVEELSSIKGTGANGRVNKADILAYIASKGNKAKQGAKESHAIDKLDSKLKKQGAVTSSATMSSSASGNDMILEMNRMRRIIADRMVESKHTAPHVTSMVEADVTNIVTWRNENKGAFLKREGKKLTFMPIIVDAVTKALRDFPRINSHLNGYNIIEKKDISIGIAVTTNSGDLMVPVIKNADRLNIAGVALELDRLAQLARTGDISTDDLEGGTFTISNFGSFRNLMGTPIINIPEVAILAVGNIEKKPAVVETSAGDVIVPRSKMYLSLSYDHRVIDGMLGGSFLRKVADYLEEFDINRTF